MTDAIDAFFGSCEDPPSTLAPSGGESSSAAQTADTSVPSEDQTGGSSDRPLRFFSLTPRGIEVMYQARPKRLYKVRDAALVVACEPAPWVEVPSVTTVLGVLDKPALPWWGMKEGIRGSLELYERGILVPMRYEDGAVRLSLPAAGAVMVPATVDTVVDFLNQEKLTVNHVRDKAGDRGTSVHDAFENWATKGIRPQPDIYPESERGYIKGLLAFLDESQFVPEAAEIMVGSLLYGFAGRYDLRARLEAGVSLVKHRTPKRGPQWETWQPGSYLLDLKTSKDVYESHFLQLEAYEGASVECGYPATVARGVILVDTEGNYKLVRSRATFADFLAVKSAHDALRAVKDRK